MNGKKSENLMMRLVATFAICAALLWMAGCTGRESDQQIQDQAQRATEQAKVDARKAAAEAKIAAANATREANDVAKGVRRGLHHGPDGGPDAVNINSASHADLETLPGVSAALAHRIAANRPYDTPHDLVRKHIVTQAEYDRISSQIVAH